MLTADTLSAVALKTKAELQTKKSHPSTSHRLVGDHQLHHRKGVEDCNGGYVPEGGGGGKVGRSRRATLCSNGSAGLYGPLTRSKSGTFSVKHVCPFVPDQPHRGIAEKKQE